MTLPPWLAALRLPLWSLLGLVLVALLVLHGINRWFDRREDLAVREAKAYLAGANTYRTQMAELMSSLESHERAGRQHRDTARAKVRSAAALPPLPPAPPGCDRWVASLSGQVAELEGAVAAYEAAAAEDSLALADAKRAIARAEARRDSADQHLARVIKVTRPPRVWLEVGAEAELPEVWDEPTIRAGAALRLQHDLVVAVARHQEVAGDRRGYWTVEGRKTFRLF